MTSWTPQNGGSKTDTSASSWVFRNDISGAADCADLCASGCAGNVQRNSAFRGTVFGSFAPLCGYKLVSDKEISFANLRDKVLIHFSDVFHLFLMPSHQRRGGMA